VEPRLEHLSQCPICGSSSSRLVHRCVDHQGVTEVELSYRRCLKCGIQFLSPRLSEADIDRLYPASYVPFRGNGVRRDWTGRGALDTTVAEFYDGPADGQTLVDFGCGGPQFLDLAAQIGWRTVGVDFVESVLSAVRDSGHRAVLASDMDTMIEDQSVDRFRLNHVLEHLYDPMGTLRTIASKLQIGGRIHIAVPNPMGPSARVFRDSWWASEPRHLILYGPDQARRVLEQAGFSDIEVVAEPVAKDFLRSYRVRRGKPPDSPHAHGATRLLTPSARALGRLGIADRFHAFATR
jgi:2-polyprenyl-3-methyl-5-hydroxy-6-metoxy-1,4-benzoquinol methylase